MWTLHSLCSKVAEDKIFLSCSKTGWWYSSSDDEYTFVISLTTPTDPVAYAVLIIDWSYPVFNIMDIATFQLFNATLEQCNKKVYGCIANSTLDMLRSFTETVSANNHTDTADFLVTKGSAPTILNCHTSTNLDMLWIGPSHNDSINNIHSIVPTSIQQKVAALLVNYRDCSEGLGSLKDVNVKILVDPSINPTIQKSRQLPILMQQELGKPLNLGVLEQVTQPPSWNNPLVIVSKQSKSIRVCVDVWIVNLTFF